MELLHTLYALFDGINSLLSAAFFVISVYILVHRSLALICMILNCLMLFRLDRKENPTMQAHVIDNEAQIIRQIPITETHSTRMGGELLLLLPALILTALLDAALSVGIFPWISTPWAMAMLKAAVLLIFLYWILLILLRCFSFLYAPARIYVTEKTSISTEPEFICDIT